MLASAEVFLERLADLCRHGAIRGTRSLNKPLVVVGIDKAGDRDSLSSHQPRT